MSIVCDYEILQKIMKAKGYRPADIAKGTGIQPSTFSDWKKGKSKPKEEKLRKIAGFLNVPLSALTKTDYVLRSDSGQIIIETSTFAGTKLPIVGSVAAGTPLLAQQNIIGYTYVDIPNDEAEYFCLRVKGNSMTAARICDGDILVVRRQQDFINGDIVIVLVNDEDATVKRIYKNGDILTLMPQSYDPEYRPLVIDPSQTNILILGKVIKNIINFGGSPW